MRLNDHEAEIIQRRRKAKRLRREREIAEAAFRAGWTAGGGSASAVGQALAAYFINPEYFADEESNQ